MLPLPGFMRPASNDGMFGFISSRFHAYFHFRCHFDFLRVTVLLHHKGIVARHQELLNVQIQIFIGRHNENIVIENRAMESCPSISGRKITPHTLRHTTAMHLLQSGVDLSVIALWLGHEQIGTTHQYMEINLDMKRAALKSLEPVKSTNEKGFKNPSDSVLSFLESL